MDKYEVKRLAVRQGLFNGRISEYVLAVVKNTKSILAESILVEILDNCYIANIKRYVQYDSYLYITDIHKLPADCHYIYGEVASISLNGQFVRKYNCFYSSACVEKYNAVEYDSVFVGQVPDEVHRVSPMELEYLTPHIYTDILVFRSCGDSRSFSEIAVRLCNRYYLPFVANEYPKVSRNELDENRLNIGKRKKQELLEHCIYRIYNVRVRPDRKHFLVNIYSETHFYETETVDYELCDEVWANELIPFQGATKEIPKYNRDGLPLGFIVGHNLCTGLSFQPSCQITPKNHQIKCDKNGYQFKDNKAWVFCLISKIDNWGNFVYVNGYDICSQKAILERNCYVPASDAIESDMLDVYIENIDLEEYRHRYKTKSVLSSVQKTETSILFVDFEIPFDKYSDALM